MIQLLVILSLAFLAVASLRRALATSPSSRPGSGQQRLFVWLAVGVLIFMAATGRLAVLTAVVAAVMASLLRLAPLLVQLLPLLHRVLRSQTQSSGSASGTQSDRTRTETAYLRMEIRHGSGEIRGSVLNGRYKGRDLDSLSDVELSELHRDYLRTDPDSAALIEAYLERVRGSARSSGPRGGSTGSSRPSDSRMTREEAYEILGLKPGATRDAIVQAHRRLMQRMHPDRGGSDYLAAKINRAKDTLLDT